MCGIAGYKTERTINKHIILNMVDALTHRGPDSEGFYFSSIYNGGMSRLKINDLEGGDQPLYNEDKSIVMLYNGEIYNSPDLRVMLENKGHILKTKCDGEVVCHLYEELGEDLFESLDGMFAIALWSEREQKLILARDIPGEKPLYYAPLNDTDLVFASEIKSIVKFPLLDLSLDKQALWDFPTFLWIPEPSTIYQSVKALPRSHFLSADIHGIRISPYRNRFNQGIIATDHESVIEETRRVVTEAVESRLLSDVPMGSFLSSGLDSSIVATLASKKLPELTTFCIAFEDVADPYHGRVDESAAAQELADILGTDHHNIHVTANEFYRDLSVFCKYGDQPFAVSSGLGILSIARAASKHGIKVLLSGDGADECFGGYSWYFHLNNSSQSTEISSNDNLTIPISFQNFGVDIEKRLEILNSYTPQKRAWAWHYYAAESEKYSLFNNDYFRDTNSSLRFFNNFNSQSAWDPEDFIRQDREFYFPFEMLRKVDRMTMAYSVEGRVPFAAPSVLSHADKLKYSQLVRNNELKYVLREAFSDILAEEIIRRPKHGFNVPIDHWLKGEWSGSVGDTFSSDSAIMKAGIIHKKSSDVAKMMLSDNKRLNGHTIFCFIMLNLWLEQSHFGNNC